MLFLCCAQFCVYPLCNTALGCLTLFFQKTLDKHCIVTACVSLCGALTPSLCVQHVALK